MQLWLQRKSYSISQYSRRALIEEIDDDVSDNLTNLLADSSITKEEAPIKLFMTESNVNKAASFYSISNKESESTPTEFGGQWAERTQPLIEEVGSDDVVKTDIVKVETVEDLEDVETPQLHSVGNQSGIPQPADEKNGTKETLSDTRTSSEGETDKIAQLVEKAGSTLDPVIVDQALLESLRQKYQ